MQPLRDWLSSYFTKKPAPTADVSPKSVSFNLPKGRTNSGLPTEPQETTGPTPSKESPTSIPKNSNLVVNEPETVTALSTLKSLFSFLSNVTQAKDNSPALDAEVRKTADVEETGKRKAELHSDDNPNNAKRAKTEMSPEEREREAMKNLIAKEVMDRMTQDNPDNSILVLQHQKRVIINEVTLDFKDKFDSGDSDFKKRLEQEIKALASLKERTLKAFSFRSNPDGNEKNPGENEPGAKRAETKKSLKNKAMQNLIDGDVRDLLKGKIDPQNKLYKETRAEVERDFEQKRSTKDPLFNQLLEKQIDLLKVQEQRDLNAKSKSGAGKTTVDKSTQPPKAEAEKNNKADSPQSYATLKLSKPQDLSVRKMGKNELEQYKHDTQLRRRNQITKASQKAEDAYLNSPQQELKREEGKLANPAKDTNWVKRVESNTNPCSHGGRVSGG